MNDTRVGLTRGRRPWCCALVLFLAVALLVAVRAGSTPAPMASAQGLVQFDPGIDPDAWYEDHEIEHAWQPDYLHLATGDPHSLDHGVYDWPYALDSIGWSIQSYQDYGGTPYFHHGLDMMKVHGTNVYNRSGGQVINIENYRPPNSLYWEVAVLDPDGYIWQYHHIDEPTIPQYIWDKWYEYQTYPITGGFILSNTYIGDIVYWPVWSFGKQFNHIHLNILGAGGVYMNGFEFHTPLPDTDGPEIQAVGLLQDGQVYPGNLIDGDYSLYVRARDLILDDVYYLPPYEVTFSVDGGPTQTTWRFDTLPGGDDRYAYLDDFYVVPPTCGDYYCRDYYIDLGFIPDFQRPFPCRGGEHTLVVTVTDYVGNLASQPYIYTVFNHVPVADPQSVSTLEDTPLAILLTGSDQNCDPLSYSLVTGPEHGLLSGTAPSLTYTPALNYNGADAFTFVVSDGLATSDPAVVEVTVQPVEDPPAADPQSVSTLEDTPLAILLTGSDPDGDPLGFSLVLGPEHGLLSGTAPSLTYTPALDYAGADPFTFVVSDGLATSDPAVVSLTVQPVNDPPAAEGDSYTAQRDTPLTVPAPGVLANDTDVDGDSLSALLDSPPTNGLVALSPDGSFVYTPTAGYTGPDAFTYRASDAITNSNAAAVTLYVSESLQADLGLSKTVDNPTPGEGGTLVYALRLENHGPADATGIGVGDRLPAGVSYLADDGVGVYDPSSGAWTVGDLPAGEGASLHVTATVDGGTAGTIITNTAAITASDQVDPVPGNDQAEAAISVSGEPCTPVTGVELTRMATGTVYTGYTVTFRADLSPDGASAPYTYTVYVDDQPVISPTPGSDDPLHFEHSFASTGTYQVLIEVWNCAVGAADPVTDALELSVSGPVACVEVGGVDLTLLTAGEIHPGDRVDWRADVTPAEVSFPYSYTLDYGDGSAPVDGVSSANPVSFSHTYATSGAFTVALQAWNCAMTTPVSGTVPVVVAEPGGGGYAVYLPVVFRPTGAGPAFGMGAEPDEASWPAQAGSWAVERVQVGRDFGNRGDGISLALDSSGQPRLAYGGNHLFYAYYNGSAWVIVLADSAESGGAGVGYVSLALDGSGQPHVSYCLRAISASYDCDDLRYARYTGSAWLTETVDGAGNVGRFTSIALDSAGRPHISYYDEANEDLKYARFDGTAWVIETVDSAGDVGVGTSLALDSLDRPHVGYGDWDNWDVKYARYDGAAWHVETVDSSGTLSPGSLALDSADRPHLSYEGGGSLYYARFDGAAWLTETVDGALRVGYDSSLALDSAGRPHVSYYDFENYDLKYARFDGAVWAIEMVDQDRRTGEHTSLALDAADYPHVGYYDESDEELNYAHFDGASWTIEVADGEGEIGDDPSLALDAAGRARISYYTQPVEGLAYVRFDGTAWLTETVDSAGDVGWHTSLALDASGDPRIGYYDRDRGDLKYARLDGAAWLTETVEGAGNVGHFASLALDAAGWPHLGYCLYGASDIYCDDLRYAHYDGTVWLTETVDSAGNAGDYLSLALDSAGRPHISYYVRGDSADGELRYAYHDGLDWVVETVDGDGWVGWHTSLALDGADQPHISYYHRGRGNLLYAHLDGSAWFTETVDSAGDVGRFTSLALDSAGRPHISYMDESNDHLKYAYRTGDDSWLVETVDADGSVGAGTALALDAADQPHIAYFDHGRGDLKYARRPTVGGYVVYLPVVIRD